MPVTSVIRVDGLVKRFGSHAALDGLDLTVEPGEIHGFLGPNGSGKSTTIRILLGLMRGNAGTATVFDRNPWKDAAAIHRRLAYVPGDVSLWPNLTGGEIIDLLTSLRGGADEGLRARLLTDFELDPRKKAKTYSKGNRQKVALVAAFARPADLFVFDEPTSGLDPLMEEVFREHVRRVRAEGCTVLLSSHLLSEVEQLCDRVTIIRAGRTVETGTLTELRHVSRLSFRVEGPAASQDVAALAGVHDVQQTGSALEFSVDPARLDEVLARLSAWGVTALTATPPSLEALFLRHYATETTAAAPAETAQ